jgi:UDP-N-acetylglucosamine acyltransferase
MAKIHPTAIVSNNAKLGSILTVGPYAVIQDDVEIGEDCVIGPHAVVHDGARIGNRVKIFQGASIANIPQDLKFDNEKSLFYIGDDTKVREFATLHRGTVETGFSKVGKNCLLMAYVHVGHDTVIGDNCIIANSVQIGGHAEIEDWVIIGGSTPVHQFSKVGQHSMVGGGFRIVVDVPPYILGGNEPLRYSGLNVLGLRRRGFSNDDINTLKDAYKIVYNSGLTFSQAKEKLSGEYGNHPLVKNIIDFMNKSKRSILKA